MKELKFQVPDDAVECTVTFKLKLTDVEPEPDVLVGKGHLTVRETDHNHTTTVPTEHVTLEYDRVKKDEPFSEELSFGPEEKMPTFGDRPTALPGEPKNVNECPVCHKRVKKLKMHLAKSPKCRPGALPSLADAVPSYTVGPGDSVTVGPPVGKGKTICPECGKVVVTYKFFQHVGSDVCKNRVLKAEKKKAKEAKRIARLEAVKAGRERAASLDLSRCTHCKKTCRTEDARVKHEVKCNENPGRVPRNSGGRSAWKEKKDEPTPVQEPCQKCGLSAEHHGKDGHCIGKQYEEEAQEEKIEEGCEACEWFECHDSSSFCNSPDIPKGQSSNLLTWNPSPEWCPKRPADDDSLSPEEMADCEKSLKQFEDGNYIRIDGDVTEGEFLAIMTGDASPIKREDNPKNIVFCPKEASCNNHGSDKCFDCVGLVPGVEIDHYEAKTDGPTVCDRCGKTIYVPQKVHDRVCNKPKHEEKKSPVAPSSFDVTKLETPEEEKWKGVTIPDVEVPKNFKKEKGSRHCEACGCQIDKKRGPAFCDKCWAVTKRRKKGDQLLKAARSE